MCSVKVFLITGHTNWNIKYEKIITIEDVQCLLKVIQKADEDIFILKV